MWRQDHLYDLVAVLGYNDNPVVPGKGSAISCISPSRIIPSPRAAWRWRWTIFWRRSNSSSQEIR
jgi:hypothetical protein